VEDGTARQPGNTDMFSLWTSSASDQLAQELRTIGRVRAKDLCLTVWYDGFVVVPALTIVPRAC